MRKISIYPYYKFFSTAHLHCGSGYLINFFDSSFKDFKYFNSKEI